MRPRALRLLLMVFTLTVLGVIPRMAHGQLGNVEAKQIAEEAFIYGFPMVMNYAVFYAYFIDKDGPEYKAPINQLYNTGHVYTWKDTAIVTPNSDTPYSFVAMDLRAEPFVVCNPEIEKSRYQAIETRQSAPPICGMQHGESPLRSPCSASPPASSLGLAVAGRFAGT